MTEVDDFAFDREVAEQEPTTFAERLSALLNSYSMENRSNTPDFILAEYMLNCLRAFETASLSREDWYGESFSPGGKSGPVPDSSREGDDVSR